MDSWALQGDSYSFLRSTPRTFSLRHRDGTPNHVEIFDITNIPSNRSAISETTCLCDIFGDDSESPSLPSSPASGSFVSSQLDRRAATSPLVDDSSGSYHTAHGSSEGEEGFEDTRERVQSPALQKDNCERTQPESQGVSPEHPGISKNISPSLKPEGASPSPQLNTGSPLPEVLGSTSEDITPSPRHNSHRTLSPEGRVSSLSSSSLDTRSSLSSPNPRQSHLAAELQGTTPTSRERDSSSSQPSLTESPSPEPRHTDSSSSEPIIATSLRGSCDFPDIEARNISPYCESSPSPEPPYSGYTAGLTPTTFEARVIIRSPSPSLCSAEIHCRETLASPELKNPSCSPETQASSPFPELKGRVSLPDLFSRGSTPDIHVEASTCIPEPILSLCATAEDPTGTLEYQGSSIVAEPVSGVSTPFSRYTPPSVVKPLAPTPESRERSDSPEIRSAVISRNLLGTCSPIDTCARSPSPALSPDITEGLAPSEPSKETLKPPSFEVRNNDSPIEPRYTAVSPEIKISTSSPRERSRKSSDGNVSLTSLDCHSISPYPRSLTASPQITGISYSVVQPEDRDSSPYPELCRLCTPESERTPQSPEPRSPTLSRNTAHSSPHINNSPCAPPEIETHKYHTPSPGPQCLIPPSEPGHQTPLSEQHHTPSELSSLAISTDPAVNQLPPVSPSTEANPECTISCFTGTADVEECVSSPDVTEIQYLSHSADEIERPSPEFKRILGSDLENSSSVVQSPSHSPKSCTSPSSSKGEQISSGQQSAYREITAEELYNQSHSCEDPNACTISAFTKAEEEEDSGALVLKEDRDTSPAVVKTTSPNLSVSLKRSKTNSPVPEHTDNSPIQKVENPKPKFPTYSPNHKCGESDISLKPDCTPGSCTPPKVGSETRERLTGNMAYHLNRKQRTSPPLTRFTPVHIIAPEKPYRSWQNRDHSPPPVATSPPTGNVKKLVINREIPSAALHDSNSQAHWHMWEQDLEIEREEMREKERVMAGQMELGRGRKREEPMHKRGERRHGGASYRGEQVELSFSARNRQGPGSHRTAPTSREAHEGMPTARSYSESLLATRQLQQQQILPRAQTSQRDTRPVGPRRLQHSAQQGKSNAAGRSFTNRPRQSSSSSMGSELDDTDNEVKWFTDVAFSSLSSPDVDYLDMYNSSHRSSTNMSQPSTQESPAGANAAWLAYADFKGSAPRLDNEELPIQQPSAHCSGGLDPTRRYEMGSFECVDVALEREDFRKVKRGVPKRQIQLKRKNTTDSKQDGGSGNSSPVAPVMPGSPLMERGSKEILLRQHSTPAAMQRSHHFEPSPEPMETRERRSKLQKAASLDETCTKTKMATCLIKSVLSKKMQSTDKQTEGQDGQEAYPTSEDITAPYQSVEVTHSCLEHSSEDLTVATQQNVGMKPSNSPSPNTKHTNFKLSQTDSHVTNSHSRNTVTGSTEKRSELMVPFNRNQQTESLIAKNEGKQSDTIKIWEESKSGDSTKDTVMHMGATFGDSNRTQDRMINRHQECRNANTERNKQFQQIDQSNYMSKTSELTLKTSSASLEKKKTSLNVSLSPEVECKCELQEEISPRQKEERVDATDEKTEQEDMGNGNNKAKSPIHKVRDVRRLVKNTYNLCFKASSGSIPSPENEEKQEYKDDYEKKEEMKVDCEKESIEKHTETVGELTREGKAEGMNNVESQKEWMAEAKNTKPQTLSPSMDRKRKPPSRTQPMQIECKAVCWKEDKNQMTPRKAADKSHASLQLSVETNREPENSCYESSPCYTTGDITTAKPCQPNKNTETAPQHTEKQTQKKADNENKPEVVNKDKEHLVLGNLPKLPSKEREVSTAVVVIQDGSNKNNTCASHVHDETSRPIQAPPSPGSSSITPHDGSGHSVSMFLKEKGYQADIGAVVGEAQSSTGVKGVACKHVNRLEIPVQSCTSPDGGVTESQRERTFSSSSSKSGPIASSDATNTVSQNKPTVQDKPKQISISPVENTQQQTSSENAQKEQGQFEAVKQSDSTFPPRSPALRRFRPQSIEVKSLSKETQKEETTTNKRPQTIEVKSIANNSQKPVVPPKPNYKFNPDTGSLPNQAYKSTEQTARVKPQSENRPQTIVVSSPTIYRKLSSDSTSSNYTRKLAVSAVSSYRPPQHKTTTATISSLSNQPNTSSETGKSNDRAQQPGDTPRSFRNTQRSTTLATDTRSASGPAPTSGPVPAPGPTANQLCGPVSGVASQPINQAAALEMNGQPQYSRQEQAVPVTSHNIKQPAPIFAPLAPGYVHANKPYHRSPSNERSRRTDDVRFYASDDPPSYDERESFSPLVLPDLPPRKPACYHPSSRPPPCSCTSGCPAHPHHHHHHRSPHDLTPPAPSHSPGQGLPYAAGQPPLRPHQCRADPQPLSYQPGSPKLSALGPSQPAGMYQPFPQPPSYPPHPALLQPCPAERPLQPHQHVEARRPPVHRSPQQQPPGVAGGPYGDHGHGHSPGLPPLDPQYLCGPQGLGPSYGSEYGGDSASLYSEGGYGQTPRRVLMDPETGKYFYIEVPVQPLRKMLFDPETGQYVEVLIPQQAMSHSGLYPPSAAPYQPLHNPNMYAPPSQYMPYVAPQHPPLHQAQAQPPRHPDASAAASMHQNGPGVSYGSPSGQGPKLDPETHVPLDRGYMESMYYVPTGMNASPNPTPSDCFHKHPATLPNAGEKRS